MSVTQISEHHSDSIFAKEKFKSTVSAYDDTSLLLLKYSFAHNNNNMVLFSITTDECWKMPRFLSSRGTHVLENGKWMSITTLLSVANIFNDRSNLYKKSTETSSETLG